MKTVFTCGCFDFCHEGHINLLKEMNKYGIVVVFLHDNESTFKNKGVKLHYSYEERERMLLDTKLVNAIIKVEKADPTDYFIDFIDGIDIGNFIYIRGDDWTDAPGISYLINIGVKVKFVKYTEGISSSLLRQKNELK